MEVLKANENLAETFEEIRKHLADNGVDTAKTPLVLGPWLAIDSDQEKFGDHPEANALLTRDYRKPFVVPAERDI